MLGNQDAVVKQIRPFDLHGVTYYDLELTFPDGTAKSARLGAEAVPDGLQAGDRVIATLAANMIVSLTRA